MRVPKGVGPKTLRKYLNSVRENHNNVFNPKLLDLMTVDMLRDFLTKEEKGHIVDGFYNRINFRKSELIDMIMEKHSFGEIMDVQKVMPHVEARLRLMLSAKFEKIMSDARKYGGVR